MQFTVNWEIFDVEKFSYVRKLKHTNLVLIKPHNIMHTQFEQKYFNLKFLHVNFQKVKISRSTVCAVVTIYTCIIYRISSKRCRGATIYFSATAMRHLFEGGAYSRAAFNSVTGTHV